MQLYRVVFCGAVLAIAAVAQTAAPAPKIALVHMENAITGTSDGKAAEQQLDGEFTPRKAKLDAQEKEIADLQSQLDKGGLSNEAKQKLTEDIEHKTLLFNLATEGADGDLRNAQVKVLKDLAPKMIAVIAQYAKDNGYVMVFDVSESDTPRMYGNATDITQAVIAEYEKKYKK